MKVRHPLLQALLLILLASVVAIVANAFAGRSRRLVLPGYYPNALRVPPREPERVPPPPVTETAPVTPTTTTAPQTPVPSVVTTTTAPASATTPATTASATAPPVTTSSAQKPAPPAAAPVARPEPSFNPHPDKAYVEISGEDAALLHAKGVLFLDARRTSVFEEGHIAGARPFSVWESDIDDKVNKLFEERQDPASQNQPIVVYCTGGACEDSHMLAQKLWGIQFNNVYVYKDGFPDWQKRGGSVHTGAQP
jgi:rhodanese-related sulfurtransferase